MESAPNRADGFPRITPVHDFCQHNQYFMCDECSKIFKKGQYSERERCAKIVELEAENPPDFLGNPRRWLAVIAARIRSGK